MTTIPRVLLLAAALVLPAFAGTAPAARPAAGRAAVAAALAGHVAALLPLAGTNATLVTRLHSRVGAAAPDARRAERAAAAYLLKALEAPETFPAVASILEPAARERFETLARPYRDDALLRQQLRTWARPFASLHDPALSDPAAVKASLDALFDESRRREGDSDGPAVTVPESGSSPKLRRSLSKPAASAARHRPQALRELLDRVSAVAAAGGTPVVLFDLDDTLTDGGARKLNILRMFLDEPETRARFSGPAEKLAALEPRDMRYHFADTARGAGVEDEAFVAAFAAYYDAHVARPGYQPTDPPNPGAVEFVEEVLRRGGTVVYFTARDSTMRRGTEDMLRKGGFPMPDGGRVRLVMKNIPYQKNAKYKERVLPGFAKLGTVVGGFENEPGNVNLFQAAYPDALMIFVDTRHPGNRDADGAPLSPLARIPWVRDFVLPR